MLDRELANRPGEPYQVLAPSRVASDYKKDLAELKVTAHAACAGIGWLGSVGVASDYKTDLAELKVAAHQGMTRRTEIAS